MDKADYPIYICLMSKNALRINKRINHIDIAPIGQSNVKDTCASMNRNNKNKDKQDSLGTNDKKIF